MKKGKTRTEWEKHVREYLRLQREADGEPLSIAAYAVRLDVEYNTWRYWFYRLTEPHRGYRVLRSHLETPQRAIDLVPEPAGRSHAGALSERDVSVLRDLAHDRCCSVDVLARRHFGGNKRQATEHLRKLQQRRQIDLVHRDPSVAYLSRRGARQIGVPPPRRMHPRHLKHHVATLRALEDLKEKGVRLLPIEHNGKQLPYLAEVHVQALERSGQSRQGTALGESYAAAPDAVIRVQQPNGQVETVAVEYVTCKYSDVQIREKASLNETYDRVIFVADSSSTAARVETQTGQECGVV